MSRGSAAPRYDEGAGSWWFIVDLGVGPDGKRRQAKRRGFRTKKAAQEELDRPRVKVHDSTFVAPKRQTLAAFLADDWLPAVRVKLEASTLESYARYLTLHVIPAIGGVHLQGLGPSHLNKLYGDLLANGRKDGTGGLSPRTVRYIATIIHAALDDGVRWGRLVVNPADRADPPSASAARAPEMKTWSGSEPARFLDLTSADRLHPAFLTVATTGAHRGEVLGLRWSDIDLDRASASIRQQVTAIRHKVVVTSKTKTGRGRQIELDARTVAALRTWRATQAQERLLLGAGYQDHGLIFCRPDGAPLHPERFSREFDRRVARHRLPKIRLHDLRHTWATLALEAGVDVKVVSERLGHASANITWSSYQHVSPAMQAGAAEKVAGLIFGG